MYEPVSGHALAAVHHFVCYVSLFMAVDLVIPVRAPPVPSRHEENVPKVKKDNRVVPDD